MDTIGEFSLILPDYYLRATILISLLSVWVLIGIFFYLNYYTRRRYFTIWAGGWLFYAIWLTLSFYVQEANETPLLLMLRQWCICAVAVSFFWGSARFLGNHVSQRLVALFLAFLLVWSYVGAYHMEDYWQARLPIYSLIFLASTRISYCFLLYRKRHSFLGAGLLAFGFFLWGVFHITYPIMLKIPELHTTVFFISTIVQLFIAVSMIILVLEEARVVKERAVRNVIEEGHQTEVLKNAVVSTEERYRSLFEQAAEGILITDIDELKIVEINRTGAQILDIQQSEAKNYSLKEFCCVDEKQSDSLKDGFEWFNYLTQQKPLYLRKKCGSVVATEVDGSIVIYGKQKALQLFVRELTERFRLEQQLRQAEKLSALGQMISGVAHELNNPLAVIRGFLEVILNHHQLQPQTRTDLEKVVRECDRAVSLVKNFLTFARERHMRREPVNINQIIQSVMELRKFTTRISNVSVNYELDKALPETMADPDQIQQVLVILINNALQAMEKSSPPHCLRLRTSVDNSVIRIEVQDNGPGVPPHLEEKIFEPFFTTKEVGTGTGLGLSLAHSILTEHKGKIYYQRPKNGGACFVVEIPIVISQNTPRPETIEKENMKIGRASFPAKVLVVDDEKSVVDMMSELLTLMGYVPTICNSAIDALEIINKQHFHVVLSDVRMPEIDGKQFYEILRTRKPEYEKRVIFLTGDTVSEDTQNFLKSTGTLHIQKPFRIASIQEAIEKTLAQINLPQPQNTQASLNPEQATASQPAP
ncbi:MAG: response regulator [Verrucomicrobiae bacterium]|nr:response regulator [Verrucomicrobiae bacterium]